MPIPAMTPPCVHDYLRELGKNWQGRGCVVELGSWLGATAAPLVEGLVEAGYGGLIYFYDYWLANEEQVRKAAEQGVQLFVGQNIEPLFRKNIMAIYPFISTHKGPITEQLRWHGPLIEFCLFDAPKQNPTFAYAIRQLNPSWIPGVTILGLLDYYFYLQKPGRMQEKFRIPVRFIEVNKGAFTLLKEWPTTVCSCVFFRYEGGKVVIPN